MESSNFKNGSNENKFKTDRTKLSKCSQNYAIPNSLSAPDEEVKLQRNNTDLKLIIGHKQILNSLKKWLRKSRRRNNGEQEHRHKELSVSNKFHSKVQKGSAKYSNKGFGKKVKYHILSNSKHFQETSLTDLNVFNPNPNVIKKQGLRPVVIDGSNVAMGHGKGVFSTNGLKICVDYFAKRGHKTIKVFLPQFRQELFSDELLEDLEGKCDMIFIPSNSTGGIRRSPYDDRYIVQYAKEFGGVIVSTDMYRDLIKENPSWQETIENRLLMFTWVDDFLMFPVDPFGKRGPTLNQLLKF